MHFRPRHALALTVGLALVVPSIASADTTAPFQMPNVRRGKRIGGEFHLGSISQPLRDLTVLGIEFLAEIPVGDRSSIRVRMPVAQMQGDGVSGTGMGNLTLGLSRTMGVRRTHGRTTAWALSGSLSLPTASAGGESGLAAAALAAYRIPYPGYYIPNATTLRVGADSHLDFGNAFVQVGIGLRLIAVDGADTQTPIRLGLAGGTRLNHHFSLVGELTTMTYMISGRSGEEWFHTLDAGLKYRTGKAIIGGRLYLPLDESTRRGLSIVGIAVDVAARY